LKYSSSSDEKHFIEFDEQKNAQWLETTAEIPHDCLYVESHISSVISNGLSSLRESGSDYEPVQFTCRITVRKKIRIASPRPNQLDMKLIDQVQLEALYPNLSQRGDSSECIELDTPKSESQDSLELPFEKNLLSLPARSPAIKDPI